MPVNVLGIRACTVSAHLSPFTRQAFHHVAVALDAGKDDRCHPNGPLRSAHICSAPTRKQAIVFENPAILYAAGLPSRSISTQILVPFAICSVPPISMLVRVFTASILSAVGKAHARPAGTLEPNYAKLSRRATQPPNVPPPPGNTVSMLYELDYTDTLGASVLKIDDEHADFGGYCAYGE